MHLDSSTQDLFSLAPDPVQQEDGWKILIVDDEEEVHTVTRFALSDYIYRDQGIVFLSAYSSQQAREIMEAHSDIAIILLDVVMEEEDSGFHFIHYVREALDNRFARIILRTGQPGIAPEEEVIFKYDINDYKDKTELTDKKLFASITTALRSYTDIMTIEHLRKNLETKVKERTEELETLNHNLEGRVRLEVDKTLQQEQLLIQQSKMAAMGEMLGVIAHQWKQPLTILSLVADTLRQNFELGEGSTDEVLKSTHTILTQVRFMSQTVDDFRNFLKPSKQKQLFCVKEAVQQVLFLIAPVLEKNFIEIITDERACEPAKSMVVYGLPSEFKQVVMNLLINAKDAIAEHMEKEDDFEEGLVTIRYRCEDRQAIIEIEDNGLGIPDEIKARIFDNYFTTKGNEGTGIGLHMCQNIIQNSMKGRLTARNGDAGAVFTITLKHEDVE